jgi:hypothetical protein
MAEAPESRAQAVPSKSLPLRQFLFFLLLFYGAIAGLRTVADFDLGWQMAESRHTLASGDTLSYTAHGASWIYPPLAGYIFRGLFHLTGYSAISWFCAGAVVLTLGIVAAGSSLSTILLSLLATPLLASQMMPRSGLFTLVLAAAFTRLLLSWYGGGSRRALWPLPLLMIAWVNLHTGFIAGIGLMLGYLATELLDLLTSRRVEARRRLRQAAPWLAASLGCTMVNPWGPRIYQAIAAQEHISRLQASLIEELQPLYRSFPFSGSRAYFGSSFWSGFNPLDPLHAVWVLLALALLGTILLVREGRIGLAVFLACSGIVCLDSSRSQGVFASVACLVGGTAYTRLPCDRRVGTSYAVFLLSLLFVGWRCTDIVTDRTSLREEQITLFGAGPSWWLPQQAADFIDRNHLPTQLFSTFNLSSYLSWRLGTRYPDFADGRYPPFGDELVAEQFQLATLPLDGPEWQQAATRYNIRTIIFPLSRFFAAAGLPLLKDCRSRTWSPVYLDTQAIVFVRADSVPPSMARLDCSKYPLAAPGVSAINGHRALAELNSYQALANAAVIYFLLGRNGEAQATVAQAQAMIGVHTSADQSLVLLSGQLLLAQGDTVAAEQSFHHALSMQESDAAWYWLGMLYANQHRYPEAVAAMRHAATLSAPNNYQTEWTLARLEVLAGEEQAALHTLEVAREAVVLPGAPGAAARAQLSDTAAAAYSQLGRWPSAISAESDALREAPTASRWHTLAAFYAAAGGNADAARAQEQADALAGKPR